MVLFENEISCFNWFYIKINLNMSEFFIIKIYLIVSIYVAVF